MPRDDGMVRNDVAVAAHFPAQDFEGQEGQDKIEGLVEEGANDHHVGQRQHGPVGRL